MNPNIFKHGDSFTIFGGGGTVHKVSYITGPYVYYRVDGFPQSVHHTNCELVQPQKFAPGDYVRHAYMLETGIGVVLDKECGSDDCYSVKWNTWHGDCRDSGESLILVSRADGVESFLKDGKFIDAIKEYRKIHGVGLKEAKDAVEAMRDKMNAPATNKYKVGDKVHTEGAEDDVGTVLGVRDGRYAVQFPTQFPGTGEGVYVWKESELFPIKPTTPTIVVRKDAGIGFRPNDVPRIHESVELAIAEAERLAKLNPGVEFATFTLVSTSTGTVPKPVAPSVTTVLA